MLGYILTFKHMRCNCLQRTLGNVQAVRFECCESTTSIGEEICVTGSFLLQNGSIRTVKLRSGSASISFLDFLVVAGEGRQIMSLITPNTLNIHVG